jgi:hypothetical protein
VLARSRPLVARLQSFGHGLEGDESHVLFVPISRQTPLPDSNYLTRLEFPLLVLGNRVFNSEQIGPDALCNYGSPYVYSLIGEVHVDRRPFAQPCLNSLRLREALDEQRDYRRRSG